jgi:competence protein ComEA
MDRMLLSLFALAALVAQTLSASVVHAQTPPKSEARPAVLVNLNSATANELDALPGIGASTAARIIEYRQKNGPFKKVEELMNVQGIGEKSFLKLRALITVAPKGDAGRTQQ